MKLVQSRIVTRDVSSLTKFYEQLTGIKSEGSDEYVEFDFSGGGLAICSKHSADIFNGGATVPESNRSVILDFQVKDVDLERIRLKEFIREFIVEPVNQPWGNRAMLFRDPDGNVINFFTVTAPEPQSVHAEQPQ